MYSTDRSDLGSDRLHQLQLGVVVVLLLLLLLLVLLLLVKTKPLGLGSFIYRIRISLNTKHLYTSSVFDAAAPVVWWTCAFGRGVPERVRRPREESGQARPRRRSWERGLDGPKREVATPFLSLGFLCK